MWMMVAKVGNERVERAEERSARFRRRRCSPRHRLGASRKQRKSPWRAVWGWSRILVSEVMRDSARLGRCLRSWSGGLKELSADSPFFLFPGQEQEKQKAGMGIWGAM